MSSASTAFPEQRWHFPDEHPSQVAELAAALSLSPLIAQVMVNRGVTTADAAQMFIDPELRSLPSPLTEFTDLPTSLDLLAQAIAQGQKIRICGDYDADGMTSTALLLRAFWHLDAIADYAIPSRMQEGYGINQRIVEDCAQEGVAIILTVDNGIAAPEPIARARELGIAVIVTDHHDIPAQLPPANAILNPKLLPQTSPYWGLAGVGVSYVLAISLAQKLSRCSESGLRPLQGLSKTLLELFTLGTIADLAPLVGVNRRWVKRGLKLLPQSQLAGIQALIQVAGLNDAQNAKAFKPEAIGFRLGPRINAIGRIADPQIVIELLTTDDPEIALARASECEQVNQQRQTLCQTIEEEATRWLATAETTWQADRVLLIVRPEWHHGVIGIVASRLVEQLGVPVFIGTYEEDGKTIRGSARSIPEFHVFEAMEFCQDLLERFGGHQAAGGFSLPVENLEPLRERLRDFAHGCLLPEHLKPLLNVDVQANFDQLTPGLYQQLEALQPCGIDNANPIFWTPQVRVVTQKLIGQQRNHLRLTLQQEGFPQVTMAAIAWRWGQYYPLPEQVDVAYRLSENHWNGETTLQLELVGIRACEHPGSPASTNLQYSRSASSAAIPRPRVREAGINDQPTPTLPSVVPTKPTTSRTNRRKAANPQNFLKQASFEFQARTYQCQLFLAANGNTLQIHNPEGKVLIIEPNRQTGYLSDRDTDGGISVKPIDVHHHFYHQLIDLALATLSPEGG